MFVPEKKPLSVHEQRVCDLVAGIPGAEEVLEDAGVDYWFGWERPFGPACKAAAVDPDELLARLRSCQPVPRKEPGPETLAGFLRHSEENWKQELAPAIDGAHAAAVHQEGTGQVAAGLLQGLKEQLTRHMATSHSLLALAEAIDRGQSGLVGRETLRILRLEHLDLAAMARDLRAESERLPADASDLRTALATVIREIHRHIKVAYNSILPRLVPAVTARRTVMSEPW